MRAHPLLLLLIFGALQSPLQAAEDSISVKAEVDRAFVTIGERTEYRVTVSHDPSLQIISKIVPPLSDAFEVKEVHDFSEKEGRQIVEGREFTLVLYELGEFILDRVAVRYRNEKGEEKSLETNRLYLTVQSVDESGKPKTDIRPVKGTISLPRRWAWLWGILLFLALTLVGVLIWRRYKKNQRAGESPREPPLPPEEEALLALNRLFDSDFLRLGKLKEYFLKLSEILKIYFERRFEILALESTTTEILHDLRQKEIPPSLIEKICAVLETSDLVKFAKFKPPPPEIVRVNQISKALIEEARPKVLQPLEEAGTQGSHGV